MRPLTIDEQVFVTVLAVVGIIQLYNADKSMRVVGAAVWLVGIVVGILLMRGFNASF